MRSLDRTVVERRTQLAAASGLRIVPLGAFMLVFAVGELGWHLGGWYPPLLGFSALGAAVATVGAVWWYRSRVGRVSPRHDWRAYAVVVVFIVALSVARGVELAGFDSPVFGTGVLLGLAIAGLAWQAPWAYAQHLVIGLVLTAASALPLGLWVEVAVPPAAAGLTEPVHPLAAYERLVAPVWLVAAGVVEHVRLMRAVRGDPVGVAR